jgi:hypothetical protein
MLKRALEKARSLFAKKMEAAPARKRTLPAMAACRLHPDVFLAFHLAFQPIKRRETPSTFGSTSRGKNWRPRFGRWVSSQFYRLDKHGSLRRNEPKRDKSVSFRTWRRARQMDRFAASVVVA